MDVKRKQWLKYFFITSGILLFGQLFQLMIHPQVTGTTLAWMSLFLVAIVMLIALLVYHCAYRRPGTRLLRLQIVLGWIGLAGVGMGLFTLLVSTPIALIKGDILNSPIAEMAAHPLSSAADLVLNLAWLFFGYRYVRASSDLRELNKSIKAARKSVQI